MSTSNTARDLLMLAATAYHTRQYDTAGALFAASMSSSDVDQFLNELSDLSGDERSDDHDQLSLSSTADDSTMNISEIAKALSAAMKEEDEEDPDEDPQTDEDEDQEDAIEGESGTDGLPLDDEQLEDDDLDSDDPDPDNPGQNILPSSISTSADRLPEEDPYGDDKDEDKIFDEEEAIEKEKKTRPDLEQKDEVPEGKETVLALASMTFIPASTSPVSLQ